MMKRLGFPSFRSAGPLAVLAAIGLALGLSPANHLLAGEANEGYEFHGVVQGLPSGSTLVGDWKVGDKVIHVTAATAFPKEAGDPAIALGSAVEVKGIVQTDGSIIASVIDSDIGGNTEGGGDNQN